MHIVLRWGPTMGFNEDVASCQASRRRRQQQTNHSSLPWSCRSCSSRTINRELYTTIQWCPDPCFSSKFGFPFITTISVLWIWLNLIKIFWQALSWTHILSRHPDFEVDFVPKYEELRSVYLTLFFCLIETLSKSPQSLSAAELTNAQNQLSELTKVGFKLDWLKSKLEEVSLERNKAVTDGCHVLEERVKNVELTLSGLQVKLDKDKIKYTAAAAGVSSFGFIGFVIKRFFLSCFSVWKDLTN